MLEADYSHALQLLLKYPAPEASHGPHTFVDDALYLKDHYNTPGGSSIIMKYTGKMPSPPSEPRPSTPESKFQGLSIRSRAQGARSPLTSPARFISQRGGVEALFQGAAKNVIERGEKLGINQAVRDALGEIRRNMQDLRVTSSNNSLTATPITRQHDIFSNGLLASPGGDERRTSAALEQRNKQLAILLEEAITSLKALAASNLEGDKEANLEAVEMAAAKAQFVKIYLEDSSLDLTLDPPPRNSEPPGPQVVIEDNIPPVMPGPTSASASAASGTINKETSSSLMIAEDEIMTDSEEAAGATTPKQFSSPAVPRMEVEASPLSPSSQPPPDSVSPHRPAPIPTRSTFAQSSFTWMLEPDEKTSAAGAVSAASSSLSPSSAATTAQQQQQQHRSTKRPSNAFLFGEVVADDAGSVATGGTGKPFTSDDIFGLEPLRRPSKVRGKYEDLFGGALGDG